MRRGRIQVALALLILLVVARGAYADVGMPLVWTDPFHLFVGTAVIGVGEGLLVRWMLQTGLARTILVMVLANYCSTWVGCIGLLAIANVSFTPTVYRAAWFGLAMLIVPFLVTVLLEWPFIIRLVRGQPDRLKRSLKASLAAQVMSYGILVPLSFLTGGTIL